MDVKVKPKISSLGKPVILAGTGITIELYTLVLAIVAVRKE
jgi:hypothetical protein